MERSSGPPQITIVTPVLNGAAHIADALQSVADQTLPPAEHLVFDAGSTDGTQDVVRRFAHCTLIEEADAGAHDAMNKGIGRAAGSLIGFLNADDRYEPEAFAQVAQAFESDPAAEMVLVGSTVVAREGEDKALLIERRPAPGAATDLAALAFGVPCINARFFRRALLERLSGFDNRFYISADRHMLLRAALQGVRAREIPSVLFEYRVHPGSLTLAPSIQARAQIIDEHITMVEELLAKGDMPRDSRRLLSDWQTYERLRRRAGRRAGRRPAHPALPLLMASLARPKVWPALVRAAVRKLRLAATETRAPDATKILRA